jgi:hypothetical protein
MQDMFAAAGTKHGHLFEQTVVPDDVESLVLKFLGQVVLDDLRRITLGTRAAQALIKVMRGFPDPLIVAFHAICLSASSRRRRSGLTSPIPTLSKRISQGMPSSSVISSMLDRLNVVLA